MSSFGSADEREEGQITDWLIAILRFAITRQEIDRATVLAVAREMDRPQPDADGAAFAFFSKTSVELCTAIVAKKDPQRAAVLRRHANRTGNQRLRAALEAATGLRDADNEAVAARRNPRAHLWKGL